MKLSQFICGGFVESMPSGFGMVVEDKEDIRDVNIWEFSLFENSVRVGFGIEMHILLIF